MFLGKKSAVLMVTVWVALSALILLIEAFKLSNLPIQFSQNSLKPQLIVLGTIQDAGSPQAGCRKTCCSKLYLQPDPNRKVVSLGLIDPKSNKRFLIEASPDFSEQLYLLNSIAKSPEHEWPDGILLSHAHIGHYTGLMYLGREAMNTKETKVYVMPKMKTFIETNGPWNQLVSIQNIRLNEIYEEQEFHLTSLLSVTCIKVPHRDEFSETVGFIIKGPDKKVLFIPDIDKWEKWGRNIDSLIKTVDLAFLDGTFYNATEIKGRSIKEIPHPLIVESLKRFSSLPSSEKRKVFFIHLNHTNPLLDSTSQQFKSVVEQGFSIAWYKQSISL